MSNEDHPCKKFKCISFNQCPSPFTKELIKTINVQNRIETVCYYYEKDPTEDETFTIGIWGI